MGGGATTTGTMTHRHTRMHNHTKNVTRICRRQDVPVVREELHEQHELHEVPRQHEEEEEEHPAEAWKAELRRFS